MSKIILEYGIYYGETLFDTLYGIGTLLYYDGSIYYGEFENGKRHGLGKFKDIYGNIYICNWINDDKQDYIIKYTNSNSMYFIYHLNKMYCLFKQAVLFESIQYVEFYWREKYNKMIPIEHPYYKIYMTKLYPPEGVLYNFRRFLKNKPCRHKRCNDFYTHRERTSNKIGACREYKYKEILKIVKYIDKYNLYDGFLSDLYFNDYPIPIRTTYQSNFPIKNPMSSSGVVYSNSNDKSEVFKTYKGQNKLHFKDISLVKYDYYIEGKEYETFMSHHYTKIDFINIVEYMSGEYLKYNVYIPLKNIDSKNILDISGINNFVLFIENINKIERKAKFYKLKLKEIEKIPIIKIKSGGEKIVDSDEGKSESKDSN